MGNMALSVFTNDTRAAAVWPHAHTQTCCRIGR